MIPLTHGLILAAILFVLGLTGLVIRRNLLFMLIGLEIMINASALAFVVAGSYWGQTDGQVMYTITASIMADKTAGPIHTCGFSHWRSCSISLPPRLSIITTNTNSTMMAPA